MTDDDNFKTFMKERQKQLGHPFNIFEFLEAKRDFIQNIDKVDSTIPDDVFKNNKYITKLCYNSIIQDLHDFGITDKDGYLLDYFKEDNLNN